MTNSNQYQPNPELDLTFERVVDVPRELVWQAWTTPELLKPWFSRCRGKPWHVKLICALAGVFTL